MARGGRGRWCERLTLQSPRQPRSPGSTARPPAPWASSRPHSASSSAAASLSLAPLPRIGNSSDATCPHTAIGRREGETAKGAHCSRSEGRAGGMAAQGRGCRRLSSKENAAVSRTNRTESCSYDTCPEKAMCKHKRSNQVVGPTSLSRPRRSTDRGARSQLS